MSISSLKHSYSSSDLEKFDGNNSESAQRRKARLAESLDADIKRWATRKEGNLRALLSTLQYVCIGSPSISTL